VRNEPQTREQRAGAADVPRCLIVTQDRFLGRLVDLVLDHGEYERRQASAPGDAEAAILQWQPHLAVLDVDIEDGAGIDLIGRWKSLGRRLPIIGVTRRSTIESRLVAFQRGVDDLLVVRSGSAPRGSCASRSISSRSWLRSGAPWRSPELTLRSGKALP
jgi:CheY-like chemotaxis protein